MKRSLSADTAFFGFGKNAFPALARGADGGRRLVYLDSACTALKLRSPVEKTSDFYLRWGGCGGGRSTHEFAAKSEEEARDARLETAAFLGASPSEIVFTSGTTDAVNLLAQAFPFEPAKNEVIVSELEHNSVLLPFYERARRGEARVRVLPARGGRIDLDALEAAFGPRTALVAVSRSSNVYGGLAPLAEVVERAHARGICVFADCAQSIASHGEDVQESGVDFIAFSAHKMGGPFGVGVLYGSERWLRRMPPVRAGGGTVSSVGLRGGVWDVRYLEAPRKFEPGVQNYAGLVGLRETLRAHARVERVALRAHLGALVRRLVRGLDNFPQARVLGNAEDLERGSIVSFVVDREGFSTADFDVYLNRALPRHRIAVRIGEHCAHLLHARLGVRESVRASFFAYNDSSDVDALLSALRAYLKEPVHA